MKEFAYYSALKNPRPKKSEFTTIYIYSKGRVLGGVREDKYIASDWPENAVKEKVFDETNYKNMMQAYYTESRQKFLEFQLDVFNEFGVSENPKALMAIEMAWDKHKDFQMAYEHFQDLLPLIT